jgi:ribosomal protein L37E
MAIIACPNCGKKISSRTAICSHCGFEFGEVTEQDLERYRARKFRETRYRLNMASYAVISVLLGAFGWYWWDSKGFVEPPSNGPLILMGLAALAYMVVRAFLFRNRQLEKSMRARQALRDGLRRDIR